MFITGEDQFGLFCISTSEQLVIHLYLDTQAIASIQLFPTRTKEGGWTVYQSGNRDDLTSKFFEISTEWANEHKNRNEKIINLRAGV